MFLMSRLRVTGVQVSSELLVVTLALGRKPGNNISCVHMFIFVLKGVYMLRKNSSWCLCISSPARKHLSPGMMCILPGHIPPAFAFMCLPGHGFHLQLVRKYLST